MEMISESHDQHDQANAELLRVLREELEQATRRFTQQPLPVTEPKPTPQVREA